MVTVNLASARQLNCMNKSQINTANRSTINQLFRYAFVGVISNAIGYLGYLLFTYLGSTPKLTMTVIYGVVVTASFFGNCRLTFSYTGEALSTGVRYLLTYLAGYFINFSILVIFVDGLGYAHQLVQAIAIFIVATFLFASLKVFVFKVAS
jgi:putative flippase GtrA